MGKFMIVSKWKDLDEYKKIAEEYQVAFEVNDFFEPLVLDSKEQIQQIIKSYHAVGLPEGSTMHGAFLDVIVFSEDSLIRKVSEHRMQQSMEIAGELGAKGVVFHTNCNPMIIDKTYDKRVIDMTTSSIENLLIKYPKIHIYLENMFDRNPVILDKISENLCGYPNYGVCLDYAHASISQTPALEWIHSLHRVTKHLHINDNDLKSDLHLALGDGLIDWKQFAEYHQTYFADCSVLIETTSPEAQRKSLEFIKCLEGFEWKKKNL